MHPQRFTVTVRYPDGREATFQLAGDEIYLDVFIAGNVGLVDRCGEV